MYGLDLRRFLALGVLFVPLAGYTQSVTVNLSENSGTPNDGLVIVGDLFSLTVSGANFPQTIGATLKLFFNSAAVEVLQPTPVSGIVLAPGSPFTGGIAIAPPSSPFPSGRVFSVLASQGNLPSGDFDAFVVNFRAIAVGAANVVIFDDQFDFAWIDPFFNTIPVTYTQADVSVYVSSVDTDGDGNADDADNCTLVPNPTQLDADEDGYGNFCDADINNSGTVTAADFAMLRSVLGQAAGFSAIAAAADMNGSGTVTTADFGLLRARLGTTPGPSGLACAGTVPCP